MSHFFAQKILNDLSGVFAQVKWGTLGSLQSGTVYVSNATFSRIGKVVKMTLSLQVLADYHHHLSYIGALFNTVKEAIQRGDLRYYTIASPEFEQKSSQGLLRVLDLSYQGALLNEEDESTLPIKQIKTTNHLDITL
jgi:predicted RNA-binding protein